MIGQTIGKYRIVARLGRGGMGTVYQAVDETLDRDVAIKVLNPGLVEPEILKRFRAEAVTLARLNHPNIATIYELCQRDDELLMVMEFVRGETFDSLSSRLGPMAVERAGYLCSHVLDALGHAHRAGIVHRDLKPANLMLSEAGVVKVMDFGIARMAGTEHLTNDGFMMGTPAYMAPEQVMGTEVDGRADLYGVGVVFYRLITGNLPFKADTAIAMVQKQIKDAPTPLRQFRAELPSWCEAVIERALAKAADDRFQTADEFRAALLRAGGNGTAVETTTFGAVASMPALETTMPPNATPVLPNAAAASPPSEPAAAAAPQSTAVAHAARPAVPPSKTEPRTVVLRRSQVAAGSALAVTLIVSLAAVSIVVIRRHPASDPAVARVTAVPAASPAPAVSAPAPAPASSVARSSPTPSGKPPAAQPGAPAGPGTAASDAHATPTDPRASDPPPVATPGPSVTAVVFTPVRLLLIDGSSGHERNAAVRLTADAVQVFDGDKTLKTIPYDAVIGLFASHSREPRWVTPAGVAVPLAKMDGGKLGFLPRPSHDWVTVRTKGEFVPLRPDPDSVSRLIAVLEQRTGLHVRRAISRD